MNPSADVRPKSEESDMQLTTSQKHQPITPAYAAAARTSGGDRCETIVPATFKPAATSLKWAELSPRGLVGGLGNDVNTLAGSQSLAISQMSEDRYVRI